MPNTNLHYPSGYYGPAIDSTYNNSVRRRLNVRDTVSFGQSTRFGGQYLEPKGALRPLGGTIMEAVGSCQQLVNELNQVQRVLPDLGNPVLLGAVGYATNLLRTWNGTAVSFIGAVTTSVNGDSVNLQFDGTGIGTGFTILYYGLTTSALNGIYIVGADYTLQRRDDLKYWWQFVKPKVFLVENGTNNKGKLFALTTDAWEVGSGFTIAMGSSLTTLSGTGIGFAQSTISYGLTTSLIAPAYTAASSGPGIGTFEYSFLSQNSMSKFVYLKNRAHRMAYWIYKFRENYDPTVSSYQSNAIIAIGSANTLKNIGRSFGNDLPGGSRYPSSFNRGF